MLLETRKKIIIISVLSANTCRISLLKLKTTKILNCCKFKLLTGNNINCRRNVPRAVSTTPKLVINMLVHLLYVFIYKSRVLDKSDPAF